MDISQNDLKIFNETENNNEQLKRMLVNIEKLELIY